VRANITTPEPIRHQRQSDWSAAWVGLSPGTSRSNPRGHRQLQTGITTPDDGQCRRKPVEINGVLRDRWYAYREYLDAEAKQWLDCASRPTAPNERHQYWTDLRGSGHRIGQVLIDGVVQFIRIRHQKKRSFHVFRRGGFDAQALGEVNRIGRQMGGTFDAVELDLRGSYEPAGGTVFADPGYRVRGNASAFCVVDANRDCTPP
jgi:hypothetical protein